MAERSFDVCVLGTSFSGLVCALNLKRKGYSVLLLYPSDNWDNDPSVTNPVQGITLSAGLKRLGCVESEMGGVLKSQSPFQVIWGNKRANLYADDGRFNKEISREFEEQSEGMLRQLEKNKENLELFTFLFNSRVHLPPVGFFKKRAYAKLVREGCKSGIPDEIPAEKYWKKNGVDKPIKDVLESLYIFNTGLLTPYLSQVKWSHFVHAVRETGYDTEQGLMSLKKSLVDRLQKLGGVVLPYETISKLNVSGKKITQVELSGAKFKELAFETLVVGGDPRGLILQDPTLGVFKAWESEISKKIPSIAVKVFQKFLIHKDALPIGLKKQGIVLPEQLATQDERRRFSRSFMYLIHEVSQTEVELVLSSYVGSHEYIPSKEKLKKEMFEKAKAIVPFIEKHLLEEPKEIELNAFEGQKNYFHESLLYQQNEKMNFGIQGLSCETPLKNTFLASSRVMPGFGLDGEYVTGLHVSDLVAEHVRGPKL